jgi:SWI/SNF-related matrix-associated actin-dependent regulator 1 of chromatin subfamily A
LNQLSTFLNERQVNFIRIDGSTPSKERHNLTQKFQTNPETRAAVLGITAAGIAITLTAASTVFFVELYWTSGSLEKIQ